MYENGNALRPVFRRMLVCMAAMMPSDLGRSACAAPLAMSNTIPLESAHGLTGTCSSMGTR